MQEKQGTMRLHFTCLSAQGLHDFFARFLRRMMRDPLALPLDVAAPGSDVDGVMDVIAADGSA